MKPATWSPFIEHMMPIVIRWITATRAAGYFVRNTIGARPVNNLRRRPPHLPNGTMFSHKIDWGVWNAFAQPVGLPMVTMNTQPSVSPAIPTQSHDLPLTYEQRRASLGRRVWTFYKQAIVPYLYSKNKKPLFTQFIELTRLLLRYRFFPYHYLKHCCYEIGRHDTFLDFVPPSILRRYQFLLNPMEHFVLVDNKVVFDRRLRRSGIPSVQTLCQINWDGQVHCASGRVEELDAWVHHLFSGDDDFLFVKPAQGWRGDGCMRLEVKDRRLNHINGSERLTPSNLRRIMRQREYRLYIVQPLVRNHPRLAAS